MIIDTHHHKLVFAQDWPYEYERFTITDVKDDRYIGQFFEHENKIWKVVEKQMWKGRINIYYVIRSVDNYHHIEFVEMRLLQNYIDEIEVELFDEDWLEC